MTALYRIISPLSIDEDGKETPEFGTQDDRFIRQKGPRESTDEVTLEELAELRDQILRLEEENHGLREKLFDAQEEVEESREIASRLECQSHQRESDLRPPTYDKPDLDIESELKDLKKTLEAKTATIRNQSQDMTAMSSRIVTLTQEITQRNMVVAELREECQNASRTKEDADVRLSSMAREHREIAKQLSSTQAKVEDAERSEILAQQLAKKAKESAENEAQKAAFAEEELKKVKSEFKRLSAELDNAKEVADNTKVSLKESKSKSSDALEEARRELSAKEAEIRNMAAQISELKVEAKRAESDRRADSESFTTELKKLMALNSQQLEMLRHENKDLDCKIMQEIKKRHEDEERWRLKEKALFEEIEKLDTQKKTSRTKKSKPVSVADSYESEAKLNQKNHEIIDLTSQNNQLTNRLDHLEADLNKQRRRVAMLEEELGFSQDKNKQLVGMQQHHQNV